MGFLFYLFKSAPSILTHYFYICMWHLIHWKNIWKIKCNLESIVIKRIPINLLSNLRTRTLPILLNLPFFFLVHSPASPSEITAAVHCVFYIYLENLFIYIYVYNLKNIPFSLLVFELYENDIFWILLLAFSLYIVSKKFIYVTAFNCSWFTFTLI